MYIVKFENDIEIINSKNEESDQTLLRETDEN